MSTQRVGTGTLLKYGGLTSPPSFATIGTVKDMKRGPKSATVLDSTTHDVTDKTKRKLGALIDEGKMSFQIWLDHGDTTHAALLANVGSTGYFQYLPANYSPAVTKGFQAVIASVSESYPVDGGQMSDVELDISGPVA